MPPGGNCSRSRSSQKSTTACSRCWTRRAFTSRRSTTVPTTSYRTAHAGSRGPGCSSRRLETWASVLGARGWSATNPRMWRRVAHSGAGPHGSVRSLGGSVSPQKFGHCLPTSLRTASWRPLAPSSGIRKVRSLRRPANLARTVTTEMGKIIAEGRGDVQEVIDFYEYAAGEGRRMFGETVPSELPNKMCLTTRLPVGPVGLITPWNFPMAIPAWKSGAALIAGCSFVLKPSSLTPLCAAKFIEVLDEVGFPPGVGNMVTGNGSVVGDGLVAHPDIRAVSLTGGVDTGKHVYEAAAKKMIKVGLELGGKNAILAMDDADLALLMDGVMFGAFGTAGQRCTAASRLIVHRKIYDRVVDELVGRAEKLRVGNPIEPTTDMGPVSSAEQEKKVLEYSA